MLLLLYAKRKSGQGFKRFTAKKSQSKSLEVAMLRDTQPELT